MQDDLKDQNGNILLTEDERQPVECWTRVMGYLRPTNEFNYGKQEEVKDRILFIEPEDLI